MRYGDGGPRVLLVEDDEGDALLVRACLAEAGIDGDDVLWTRTLQDATAALRRRPRCVLLDLGLPDAEGLAALMETVQASPDTPVIVLTGRHDHTGTEALALGAQDYLVKDDITADLLSRSIRYAVERKRAQRTSQQLREAQFSSAEKSRLERGLLATPLLRSHRVQCSTYYQPGRDHAVLGGDFFDVIETPDHRVRMLIGDVMGHGPDEAAIGVHLRVAWRTLVLAGTPDTALLPTLSTLLAAETGGNFGYVPGGRAPGPATARGRQDDLPRPGDRSAARHGVRRPDAAGLGTDRRLAADAHSPRRGRVLDPLHRRAAGGLRGRGRHRQPRHRRAGRGGGLLRGGRRRGDHLDPVVGRPGTEPVGR
jgi:CheY-like chemotaxis protein